MNFKKIIHYCYLLLFFATPLIFTSINSELFELPKMYFVYALTIVISTLHLTSYLKGKTPLIKKNPLTIPLLLFLTSQTISTIISADIHTSIFGYYSRLNGGLLSTICYTILFLILYTHNDRQFGQKIITASLSSGLIISLYAIGQHLGIDKTLWVQDVQKRVFSTLGQPNWLAALLCILIPLSFYQYLLAKNTLRKIYSLFLISSLYASLLFSKSKSGIISGLISLTLFLILSTLKSTNSKKHLKTLAPIVLILLHLTLTLPSPIKNYFLSKNINPPPTQQLKTAISPADYNVTPSQDIRKIVWTGAIDLWRQFPYFGTGTESFAYTYYWTRPAAHNLTSEWEFLYNKAHNEYLNYLATTGTLGLLTYSIFLIITLIWLTKLIQKHSHKLASITILSAFTSILFTNFAGFSVVSTNLYLFLLPALITSKKLKTSSRKPKPKSKLLYLPIIIISSWLLLKNLRFYLADISFAAAQNSSSSRKSLDHLKNSLHLRPLQPNYLSKASIAAAQLALKTKDNQTLIDLAISYSTLATDISPANTNFLKEQAQMYYYLSTIDQSYFAHAIESLVKVTALAPTDAKAYYLLARFLETANLTDQAINYYQQAIDLKANYDHAHFALGQIYFQQKNLKKAQNHFQSALDINPKNTEAKDYLDQIKTLL